MTDLETHGLRRRCSNRPAIQANATAVWHLSALHFACNTCVVWTGAGEEERRRAHEALEAQEAELARYAEQVAADQQQAAALQAKIKAMEEKASPPPSLLECA